jgi:hypothetical protein
MPKFNADPQALQMIGLTAEQWDNLSEDDQRAVAGRFARAVMRASAEYESARIEQQLTPQIKFKVVEPKPPHPTPPAPILDTEEKARQFLLENPSCDSIVIGNVIYRR